MTDLAIVIVTWNVRELVLEALRSLIDDLNTTDLSTLIYVVDCDSTDGTLDAIHETFPQVRLIASRENLGFARANNLALRQIGFGSRHTGDFPRIIYFLNPDTITQPGATQALYDTLMTYADAGVAGANLTYNDGTFQHGAFMFPDLRQIWAEFFPIPGRFVEGEFNGRYPRENYRSSQPFRVDFVLGATMMIRSEIIQHTGMFDESYFMYCEEIDWAWRIRSAGWQIYCVPNARVIHIGGQSTGQIAPQSIVNLWTSRLRLYDKHYPLWQSRIAHIMIALGMKSKIRRARKLNSEDREALIAAYRAVHDLALERLF